MTKSEKQKIAIIVAFDNNRAIGWKGEMPWRLSADLKRFKKITMDYPVIMGRKTFESLPNGALPGRINIVVTGNIDFSADNIIVAHSPEQAVEICRDSDKVFIIGGGNLYREFIKKADILYLTQIDHNYQADTWFPEYDADLYEVVEEEYVDNDPKFPYPYSFKILKYKNK